ncbi:MAG: arginase family protein [Acidimicrobiia bacterium]|nr:arginase family protein [Acidimicrobiia bacterium]
MPPAGPLYVHVDLDVVDPGEMPAMNYPAADGPHLRDVRMAMIHLATTGRIVAFSISSWNPSLPGADVAAAAAARLAAPFLVDL